MLLLSDNYNLDKKHRKEPRPHQVYQPRPKSMTAKYPARSPGSRWRALATMTGRNPLSVLNLRPGCYGLGWP
jgi:hypothetical protein